MHGLNHFFKLVDCSVFIGQGGPETEAGDQGPAAPDQRVTITKLI